MMMPRTSPRDYKSFFGITPMRDVERLQVVALVGADV
jgi:hypothetical protein